MQAIGNEYAKDTGHIWLYSRRDFSRTSYWVLKDEETMRDYSVFRARDKTNGDYRFTKKAITLGYEEILEYETVDKESTLYRDVLYSYARQICRL